MERVPSLLLPWCGHSESHDLCEWAGSCRQARAGWVEFQQKRHPLCAEHLKAKYHPPDLRGKLRADA